MIIHNATSIDASDYKEHPDYFKKPVIFLRDEYIKKIVEHIKNAKLDEIKEIINIDTWSDNKIIDIYDMYIL